MPRCTSLPRAAAQAVAKLAEGIGVSEFAEQQRDQQRPAAEAFGGLFGVKFFLTSASELRSSGSAGVVD